MALTLEEQQVPSAQVELLQPPSAIAAGTFHPSVGLPEEQVGYRICPLFPPQDPVNGSNGCNENQKQTEASPFDLVVTIPPASIPLIFAHRQWRAGLILADLIAYAARSHTATSLSPFSVEGKTVLELGCGTGVPGMMAARVGGADLTLLTDYDSPPLVKQLKANVARNFELEEVRRKIRSTGYTWGGSNVDDIDDLLESMRRHQEPGQNGPSNNTTSRFDRILIADCLWDTLSHAALLKSFTQLLAPQGQVLVVSGLHTGRETLCSFVRRAARVGLELFDVVADALPDFPALSDAEHNVANTEEKRMNTDDPLRPAPRVLYELELMQDSDSVVPDTFPRLSGTIDTGSGPRLSGRRRAFVVDERPEERKDAGGVHYRNRWITVWGLRWKNTS